MITDKQEMFNAAYIDLAGQGFERSVNGGICLYRGPNGTKCAIGYCLSDEEASKFSDSDGAEAVLYELVGEDIEYSFVEFANDL